MEIERQEYAREFDKLAIGLRNVFPNESGFENMKKYMTGLMGSAERKNGWQMSECLGASTLNKGIFPAITKRVFGA